MLERISESVGGRHAVDSRAPLGGRVEEFGSIVRKPMFQPSSIDVLGDDSREGAFIGVRLARLPRFYALPTVGRVTRDWWAGIPRNVAGAG